MAKRKEAKASRMGNLLASAKKGHIHNVGAGGSVFDPNMSSVRGVRLPSLGLMYVFGFSALRDSCTVLIDGETSTSKSSLAIDILNWGLPYGAAGAIIDTENKAAVDIANGMLNDVVLYLPGHLTMKTCNSVEETQQSISREVERCRQLNGLGKRKSVVKAKPKGGHKPPPVDDKPKAKAEDTSLSRNSQIPMIIITDSLAAAPAEETKAIIQKQGYSDRGHGGRLEALLWSIWLKEHETSINSLPVISVFVNHLKKRTEQKGSRTVSTEINPGGSAQNYATTIHLRCGAGTTFLSKAVDGVSYQDIYLKCVKNSRGPTGLSTRVRKCSTRNEDGSTTFWWDWGLCTAEFLVDLSKTHPARKICDVKKTSDTRYTCAKLKLTDVKPSVIGDAVNANASLVDELMVACRIKRLVEFDELTEDEFKQLSEQSAMVKAEYLGRVSEL